jgi:hypothetical protein
MPDAFDALLEGIGLAHDTVTGEFFGDTTQVLLLRPTQDAEREYEVLWQIVDKWFFEYSNFRGNFLLEIASTDPNLETYIPLSTHLQIDEDVYVILRQDTIQPKGTDITWKIYCTQFAKKSNYAAIY